MRAAHRPEVLAPAGNHDALRAALAAGADAVYFGLDDGFNARARAKNFAVGDLDHIVRTCHRAGARAYLTLNTLVFEDELPLVEEILRRVGASGVDALIVQDPAVALLAARVCPELELHASTQMTISSPEAARFAAGLGVTRVVLPRELTVDQIRTFRAGSELELEVFAHGALCMSWSGQCLTSEAWGGRSANRGQCAQSCRLPYGLVVDGEARDLGEVRYLLSPSDLAAHEVLDELVDAGVHTLKVEGRLKGPAYVQTAVASLHRQLDAVARGEARTAESRAALADDLAVMHRVYSRGFTTGFLAGVDHQRLVDGRHPKHRGSFLGRVVAIRDGADGGAEVIVRDAPDFPILGRVGVPAEAPLVPARGMGVVFDLGDPQDPDEPGAAIFSVRPGDEPGARWVLGFARDPTLAPDLSRVRPGHRVWVNSDPAAEAQAQRSIKGDEPQGRVPARLVVAGALGEPLRATLHARSARVAGATEATLAAARGEGLSEALLASKLGALGGTVFHLAELDRRALPPGLFVPPGALKALRRDLVARLEAAIERGRVREIDPAPALAPLRDALRAAVPAAPGPAGVARLSQEPADGADVTRPRSGRPQTSWPADIPSTASFVRCDSLVAPASRPGGFPSDPRPANLSSTTATLVPLCRRDAQLDAAIALGCREVELDWMEMVGLGRAVARAREAGVRVTLATTRVQKPGEEQLDARIARLEPDGVLVRHWGGLMYFADGRGRDLARTPSVHGDFSLNVTNSVTFWRLLGLGLDTVTASHDLDERQLMNLVAAVDPARLAVVLHHHIPTFHTEHCVYAHVLSDGADYRSCGRPCERQEVSLRDPKGLEHPVIVDVFCRNTVFEARAQSAAALVPRLLDAGVRRFRVELVRETAAETTTVLAAYADLLAGRASPRETVRRIGVHEQFGVVRGVARSARDEARP